MSPWGEDQCQGRGSCPSGPMSSPQALACDQPETVTKLSWGLQGSGRKGAPTLWTCQLRVVPCLLLSAWSRPPAFWGNMETPNCRAPVQQGPPSPPC